MDRFVVISGCSGGGKSTLLAELARRGFATVEEPGRRIVAEQLSAGGTDLPWVDLAGFARRAVSLAQQDRVAAQNRSGWVFFDRGLVDAAAALAFATGEPLDAALCAAHRSNRRVFLTPPWPEIFAGDDARRHDLTAAMAEYERLLRVYPDLGYEVTLLPKLSVAARADFLLATLGATDASDPPP
ncbi:AAA family ATPase [Ancylobacter polymorphus]|uniref:AAA family ATPase n=1 Tax=Ancylobacter polymorphus TaxID=223390 RepID=A0A9E7CVB6_9HYPH|nr:AAA family ATPase [Ancylobacter polymorphus]UOK70898.1 AAA family ATPase [Ancylobacter polymorphus]